MVKTSSKKYFPLQKFSFLFYKRVINKNLLNESEIYYFSIMDTVLVAS